ncbi:MAG: CotS family spore coat protein [Sarcina sp.]
MNCEEVSKLIEEKYNIRPLNVEKRKNIYKITASTGNYCLKVINYEFSHFYFITSVIEHLRRNGFYSTPGIERTKENKNYIEIESSYAYLIPWIRARNSDYKIEEELKIAIKKLRELHSCSEGFKIDEFMKPRIGWFKWIETYETRVSEILDFKKRIGQKIYKSDFDKLYLEVMDEEIERANRAIKKLKESNYMEYMSKDIMKLSVCHHDYAHHNVIIDDNEKAHVIDFDYCILDSRLHDLSSLLIRAMKDGLWSIDKFNFIIENYDSSLTSNEKNIMAGFIEFPQEYWQVGLQYYWERQPWVEERFMKKLTDYVKDRSRKDEFINSIYERGL